MPLTKLKIAPGFNREVTRYSAMGAWWDGDWVRFRMGFLEKIGGFVQFSANTFQGVARALYAWVTLGGAKLLGVGTHLKYYVVQGGTFYDVTPLRATATLTNPFTATDGSATITVTDVAHGCTTGDFVTFSGASGLGGNIIADELNTEFQVTVLTADTYTVQAAVTANSTDAAGSPGGGTVTASYQISIGAEIQTPLAGWSAGAWGLGTWGFGETSFATLRVWSQSSFGEDLIFCPRGGALYYWVASGGSPYSTRAVLLSSRPGASSVPVVANSVLVSDVSRFVMLFGANPYGTTTLDPMLVRWSDQENAVEWVPSALNQAGELRLSVGSEIVARLQTRQEVLVWTDAALYSMQYSGPPAVWGAQILADNLSIVGPNAVATINGRAYWMGNGKFYKYEGAVDTLDCTLRRSVFEDFNYGQMLQVFAGTVEEFNEVWWVYPSAGSTVPNKYVVFNYEEQVWYSGTMTRYAWLDSGLYDAPLAIDGAHILQHETGTDDAATDTPTAIHAYGETATFDLVDGDHAGFCWRVLPDVTFQESTAAAPQVTMTFYPMKNAGTGLGVSVGGTLEAPVTRSVSVPVEQFTGEANIRLRGRHAVLRVESNQLGCQWQLGTPRLQVRSDGLRG